MDSGELVGTSGHINLTALKIGAAAVACLAIFALGACSGSRDKPDDVGSAATETSSKDSISGTADDWLEAICRPGKFKDGININGGIFNGSLGGGMCWEPVAGRGTVYFTQWDSNFKMRNSMEQLRMCYTSAIDPSGLISTFSVNGADNRPFQPLAQFGFYPTC